VPNVVLASQFDVLGNRTSLSATIAGTKDFFNSFGYDALSQLLSVTQMGQSGGNAVAPKGIGFAYNLDGQFTGALRFDPTTASPHPDIALGTFSYDAQGRLASLAYTHAGNPIDTFGYQYDTLDRVSQFSSIDGTASYAYDKTSQLTSVVYTGGGHQPANESFQYDPNGNQKGPSPAGPNFTVGADNLLSSDGTFDLFYDAEGNLIEKKRISTAPATDYDTKQAWDYRNRLTDVWQYNNSGVLTQHEHLVYDPFDRLIGRYIDSTGNGTFDQTQLYVYDGSDVVLQFNPGAPGPSSLTNRYLNGPSPSGSDQVFAEEDVTSLTSPGTVTWPLTDQQGSPRDIVNSLSVPVDHIIYSAFGQTVYESSTSVHHLEGFAGGLPDPVTGEIHFGARNLNAVDAVWSSQDPLGFGGGDTNVSRYVGNSPTNYTDPTGLDYIKSVELDDGTVSLFYVDEQGIFRKDARSKFIGIYDPNNPDQTVTRDGKVVFYQDVVDEVHDWGSTTDDWDAWFAKHQKNFSASTALNLQNELCNPNLPPHLQMTRGQRRADVERMQGHAKDGMQNAAMAGFGVTRGFQTGAGVARAGGSAVGRLKPGVSTKFHDAASQSSLRGKSLISGTKALKDAGLVPRKAANGAWEFLDETTGAVRAKWVPRCGKEPPHWSKFEPNGNQKAYLNDAGRPVTSTDKAHRIPSNGGSPKGGTGPGSPGSY